MMNIFKKISTFWFLQIFPSKALRHWIVPVTCMYVSGVIAVLELPLKLVTVSQLGHLSLIPAQEEPGRQG